MTTDINVAIIAALVAALIYLGARLFRALQIFWVLFVTRNDDNE